MQRPAPGEHGAQRGGGQRQRQAQRDVAQRPRHALYRPDDAAQQQRGVERAERELDRVPL